MVSGVPRTEPDHISNIPRVRAVSPARDVFEAREFRLSLSVTTIGMPLTKDEDIEAITTRPDSSHSGRKKH